MLGKVQQSPLFGKPHVARLQQTGVRLGAALTGVFLVSLFPRLYFAQNNPLSYDESHLLTFGVLANAGNTPYTDAFIGITPLSLLLMQVSALGWKTVAHGRLILVFLSLLGVAAVFGLGRLHAHARALPTGVLAALIFSFTPVFFAVSTTLNVEAGTLALGLMSLLAATLYVTRRGRGWLALSGLLFGASIAVKLLVPFLPAVVLVQLLLAQPPELGWGRRLRRLALELIVWAAAALCVLGVLALIYGPAAVYQEAIAYRLAARTAVLARPEGVNVVEDLTWGDLAPFLPLGLAAIWGMVEMKRAGNRNLWVWLAWLVLGLLFLTLHVPLRARHLVIVTPPLAVFSGVALAGLGDRRHWGWGRTAAAVAGIIAFAALIAWSLNAAPTESFIGHHPARANVVSYLQGATAPDDCVVSKENRFYFLAERFPPPYLSELGTMRLVSGMISPDAIVRQLDERDCPTFVYSDSFDKQLDGLRPAVADLYALELQIENPDDDDPIPVYAVPMKLDRQPAHPWLAKLGQEVEFLGYDLTPDPTGAPPAAGAPIYLSTYWRALRPLAHDYKFFVHLVDRQGNLVAGVDHFPYEARPDYRVTSVNFNPQLCPGCADAAPSDYPNRGLFPTSLWMPGQMLKETIMLPPDLPAGDYTIRIGLYDPATMQRLDVDDSLPAGDQDYIEPATLELR